MSYLLSGYTTHTRLSPVHHFFKYPLLMMEVDGMAPLPKTGLYQFDESDFLFPGPEGLYDKITKLLRKQGYTFEPTQIRLVSIPAHFKRFFRPVSFYLLENAAGNHLLIAEVTNTYGERHLYISTEKSTQKFRLNKQFHVSPFFEETGEYVFFIKNTAHKLMIRIQYLVDKKKVFEASFFGTRKPYTAIESLKAAFTFPFNAALTFPRILWQAAQLFYQKKLSARSKPMSTSSLTVKGMSLSPFSKFIFSRLDRVFKAIQIGHLKLILPNRETRSYGDPNDPLKATLHCHHTAFFTDIAKSPEMGLGESYIKGYWDTPDLAKLLKLLAFNGAQFEKNLGSNPLVEGLNRLAHRLKDNTLTQAKENIQAHYDLSNDFYDLFLDAPHKQYSAGMFSSPDDSLEKAQKTKVQTLINKLGVSAHHHVLEIGTGWGGLAIELVKQTGCRVTTVTLSKAQKDEAEQRIRQNSLTDLITVKLMDFRHLNGRYDRIISVEMIEAVGHRFLPTYFKCLNALLKPEGQIVLQAITYPCQGYDAYRKGTDFIKKHIFPGGHLPSLTEIMTQLQDQTSLRLKHIENIGDDYALTLKAWRERFESQRQTVLSMGFDETFIRKWTYYLAYCEAGFHTKKLTTHQIVLNRFAWEVAE